MRKHVKETTASDQARKELKKARNKRRRDRRNKAVLEKSKPLLRRVFTLSAHNEQLVGMIKVLKDKYEPKAKGEASNDNANPVHTSDIASGTVVPSNVEGAIGDGQPVPAG